MIEAVGKLRYGITQEMKNIPQEQQQQQEEESKSKNCDS